jgi:hypothetical protein
VAGQSTIERADNRAARLYLRIISPVFLAIIGLPLLLNPYAWARAFGWRKERETDIGLYFGRCLGAVATGISVQALRASREPSRHRSFFGLIELVFWLMSAVHLKGLLERRQPPVEDAEIIGYAALAVLTRRVRPAPEPVEPTS